MDEKEFKLLLNKLEFLARESNKARLEYRRHTGRGYRLPLRMDEFKSKFEIKEIE